MSEADRASRGETIVFLLILCVAAALRLITIVEVRELGFFRQPLSDGRVYVERARQIAAGDWLGPAEFVHAPLYAYFLAALSGPTGDFVWSPRIAQAGLGVITVALVYFATRRLFDRRAALLAAGLCAAYPPAIFFDVLIQKASLTLALSALVIAASVWASAPQSPRGAWLRWALVGVALGALVLNRQHALVYLPLIAAWAWLGSSRECSGASPTPLIPVANKRRSAPRSRFGLGSRLAAVAALAVGCFLLLVPWVVRNRVVLSEWVLTTPNLGQNFAMGVGPRASGTYLPIQRGYATGEREQAAWTREAETALGRKLSPREVSAYFFGTSLDWIRDHPWEWVQQTVRKVGLVWGAYELPDTEDYYLYQEHSRVLRWLDRVLHFGVLTPLAAAGLVLSLAATRRLWPLQLWLILTTLSIAAFVVLARYRLPLVPVLIVLAGAGIAELLRRARLKQVPSIAGPLAVAAAVALLTNWVAPAERKPRAFAYCNHGIALADQQRFDEAIAELDRALSLAPTSVDTHQLYGSTLLEMGRYEASLRHYQQARDGDPNYGAAWRGMGDALDGLGHTGDAVACYQQAVKLEPFDPVSRSCLGAALAREGQFDAALEHLTTAVRDAPRYAEAHLNLGNTYLAMDRLAEADAAYERAINLRPDYTDAWFNRGVLAMRRQAPARAAECFAAVLSRRPDHELAQQALIRSLLASNQHELAMSRLGEMLRRSPERKGLQELQAQAGKAAADRRP